MKKFISMTLISLFSLFLIAGCSQDNHKAELKKAFDNTATLQSTRADLTVTVGLDASDESESQNLTFSAVLETIGNKKSHFEVTLPSILATSLGTSKYIIYTETTNTSTIVYMYDGTTWTKQTTALTEDTTATASPTASIDLTEIYSDFVNNAEYKGEENVDSTACYKYQLTLDWDMLIDAVEKVAESNPGLAEGYDSSYTAAIKAQLASYPPVKLTIWVDKSAVQLKQLSIDATDTVKSLYKAYNTGESDSTGGINKLILQIKYYDYNNVQDITIPADAKNAKSSSSVLDPYTSILGE